MGIVLNLQIVFGKMVIFIILILLIYEYGRFFYFLRFFLIFFFSVLKFLLYRFFICLVKVISRYFILFGFIMKGVVFLIFFSVCFFFVQRKVIDLFELILYLVILLKLFISFSSFLVEFLGLFKYIIILFVNSDILIFFFSICIFLIFFCCLIVLVRILRIILNKQGESGQFCLVFDFSGIVLSFFLFSLMLVIGLLYMVFIMFRYGF